MGVVQSAYGALGVNGGTINGNLAVSGAVTIGGVASPAGQFLPGDVGYLAWTYDPTTTVNSSPSVNGTLYLAQVILRTPQTISTLSTSLAAAAVTPTANQNFLGLYDSSGVRQAVTAPGAIDAATASTGPISQAVITPYAAPAGKYWVAVLLNATTPAQFARASGFQSTPNAGTAGATLRWAVNGTAQTTLPTTITPASNTSNGNVTLWAAVS
jgi:hypothetical protein